MGPEDPFGEYTEIHRRFELDAGHRLSEHNFKCQNLHGHRYQYEVTIGGYPDETTGYVVDFSNVKGPVMDAFDHNFLFNEDDPVIDLLVGDLYNYQNADPYLLPVEPTVENIAIESFRLMWGSFSEAERKAITEVRIQLHETPNCDVLRRFSSERGATEYYVVR